MERKIGEIFEHNGEWYQCMKGNICIDCAFYRSSCGSITGKGSCRHYFRGDATNVIFKKLEKVGEPRKFQKRTIQTYKLYTEPFILVDMDFINTYLNGSNTIDIIIKHDIENMEEKKLNLKPFDLQKAKDGKPVCTRDGRKAKVICFDRKFYHDGYNYPIVAMVNDNDNELVHAYTQDGLLVGNAECELDLMMLPEKRSGWVNVYKGLVCISVYPRIYKSREEAISDNTTVNRIDTVKISWEE